MFEFIIRGLFGQPRVRGTMGLEGVERVKIVNTITEIKKKKTEEYPDLTRNSNPKRNLDNEDRHFTCCRPAHSFAALTIHRLFNPEEGGTSEARKMAI